MFSKICMYLMCCFAMGWGKMEPFIVNGKFAQITHYPHSAFLSVSCVWRGKLEFFVCGSSIVNQRVLLTAAHCLYDCDINTHVGINVGDAHRDKGQTTSAKTFIIHEKYSSLYNDNDIALIETLRPLTFSSRVSRVAIMKNPPPIKQAEIAGWGTTDDNQKNRSSEFLMELKQVVLDNRDCLQILQFLPTGGLCARSLKQDEYVASGDSGSALTVQGYIQIGIVSYKVPTIATDVIVYADVAYYYPWIMYNAMNIFCKNK